MPDHGVPEITRWHVSWVILAAAWAIVSYVGGKTIVILELDGMARYLGYAATIPFYWFSASRVLAWGRRE